MKDENWPLIPPQIKDALILYRDHKIAPSPCLLAILRNDLYGACAKADSEEANELFNVVVWMAWHLPPECKGSAEIVDAWLAERD